LSKFKLRQISLIHPRTFSGGVAIGREYLKIFGRVGGDEGVAKRHLFLFFDQIIRDRPDIAAKLKAKHSVAEYSMFLDEYENWVNQRIVASIGLI
jgi:hypothetical protein